MASDKQKRGCLVWYIIAAVFGVLLFQQIWTTSRQTAAISYSEFEQLASDKKISQVVIDSEMIQGTLKEKGPDGKDKFVTVRVDPVLADRLAADGIEVTRTPRGFLLGHVADKPVASEAALREIDLTVRGIVDDAFDNARASLMRRRTDLDKGADLLLAKEPVTAVESPPIQQAKAGNLPLAAPAGSAGFWFAGI